MAYLFSHFKEKITSDGEQVYFSISKDGFNWELLNKGEAILSAELGEKGCRDIECLRLRDGSFVILTTDLSISNRMDENFQVNWKNVNRTGSKCLRMWKSQDLISFTEEELLPIGRDDFGCMWAPEVIYDDINDEYVIHWGSTVAQDNYSHMSIYYSVTKDFVSFSRPKLFFTKQNEILDTHIRKIKNKYHMFYKNANNPGMNMHAVSDDLYGPYIHDDKFQGLMSVLDKPGSYEAPTTFVLPDGKWCLMLDFFGCEKEKMGYIPYISPEAGNTDFIQSKDIMSFPYGFKHGGVIEISDDEYYRLKNFYK